jgi:hypothetical protein
VYLALFGSDRVKVGVSSAARLRTRWAEQGTDYGVYLARVQGGMPARRLEYAIGRIRSLTKVMRGETKMSLLLDVVDQATAEHAVENVLAEGGITPEYIGKFNGEVVDWPPRAVSLSSVYQLGDALSLRQHVRSQGPLVEGTALLGEVVGMKGSMLVTRLGDSLVVADLRRLIGYSVVSDASASVVTQASLGEFI